MGDLKTADKGIKAVSPKDMPELPNPVIPAEALVKKEKIDLREMNLAFVHDEKKDLVLKVIREAYENKLINVDNIKELIKFSNSDLTKFSSELAKIIRGTCAELCVNDLFDLYDIRENSKEKFNEIEKIKNSKENIDKKIDLLVKLMMKDADNLEGIRDLNTAINLIPYLPKKDVFNNIAKSIVQDLKNKDKDVNAKELNPEADDVILMRIMNEKMDRKNIYIGG